MTTKPNTAKPKTLDALAGLARELDRNRAAIRRMLQRDDWPFPRAAPWRSADLPAMRKWIAAHVAVDKATARLAPESDPLKRELIASQIALCEERCKALALDFAIREGHYIKRETVSEEFAAKWLMIRKGLEQIPRALRQELAECTSPAGCEDILAQALRNVCNAIVGQPPPAEPAPAPDPSIDATPIQDFT